MNITQRIMAVVYEWFPFIGVIVSVSLILWAGMMLTGKRQEAERVKILTGEIAILILFLLLAICVANWVLEGI